MRYTHQCRCSEPDCDRELSVELCDDGAYLVCIEDHNDNLDAACAMTAEEIAAWLEESDGELFVSGAWSEYTIEADIDAVRMGLSMISALAVDPE